jgi:two-component system, NtrC family, response regulator HupR/HoxA
METKTVLFVDDEERLLTSLKRGLMDEPYKCLFANSGPHALEVLSKNKVHVIITDMRMPEMNGLELLRIVREKYPDIIRIVLSGYTQITTLLTAINEGHIYKYITKPWKLEEEFKPQIREALAYYDKRHAEKEVAASGNPK